MLWLCSKYVTWHSNFFQFSFFNQIFFSPQIINSLLIIKKAKEEAEKKDAIIKKAKEEAEMKDAMIESLTKSLQVAEGKIKEAEDNFFSSVSSEEDGN